jgi:hypothetical protein
MKWLLAILILAASVAAQAQTGWTKYSSADEITNKVTTVYFVSSATSNKITLMTMCISGAQYLTLNPHFQVDHDENNHTTLSVRTDDTTMDTDGTVYGDLDDAVRLGYYASNRPELALFNATKVIKIKLNEFGRSYHVLTFNLNGAAPVLNCPK